MEALTPPRPNTVPMLGCWEPPGQPRRAADTARGRTAQAADGWPPLPHLPSHMGMHPIGKTSVPERTLAAKRAEPSIPQCPVEAAGWGLYARLPLRPAPRLPEQNGSLSVRGSPLVPRSRCVLCVWAAFRSFRDAFPSYSHGFREAQVSFFEPGHLCHYCDRGPRFGLSLSLEKSFQCSGSPLPGAPRWRREADPGSWPRGADFPGRRGGKAGGAADNGQKTHTGTWTTCGGALVRPGAPGLRGCGVCTRELGPPLVLSACSGAAGALSALYVLPLVPPPSLLRLSPDGSLISQGSLQLPSPLPENTPDPEIPTFSTTSLFQPHPSRKGDAFHLPLAASHRALSEG